MLARPIRYELFEFIQPETLNSEPLTKSSIVNIQFPDKTGFRLRWNRLVRIHVREKVKCSYPKISKKCYECFPESTTSLSLPGQ
jgi:hypothetical protein